MTLKGFKWKKHELINVVPYYKQFEILLVFILLGYKLQVLLPRVALVCFTGIFLIFTDVDCKLR